MEHITDTRIEQSQPTAVTLGNFDGLHLGHRSLINLTKQFAEEQGLKSVVFTFSPHPMLVFKKKDDNIGLEKELKHTVNVSVGIVA